MLDFDGRVVDRRQEMIDLLTAVESAGRADGVCVLISGVPGVGKSTLVQAFGAEISERNCVFAYGRCRDGRPRRMPPWARPSVHSCAPWNPPPPPNASTGDPP